ncbi:MAG: heavy metal sensor histidine kinase [Gemmatimonadaceae bacterium]|nr:heavy metal sensor histidine kinase [Gemmatimonadaceae bacterium]
MSSTNSSPPHEGTVGTRARRPWSIAGRLTQHYAGSTVALLLIAASFLYWGLIRELHRQDRRLVASKLLVLRHLVAQYPTSADALSSEIEHEAGEGGPLQYYLRIVDGRGVTLLETPGMDTLVPSSAFPPPTSGPVGPDECSACKASDDHRYLLLAATGTATGVGAEYRQLQVALDVSATTQILADYRAKLIAVLGLGLLAAVAVGVVVARVALQPVNDISRRAQAISASRLDARLCDERPWPTELRGLASDFDAMLDRLQAAFTRLSQFSADLAHALRNPINNLRGEAEVALARARTPEEYQQVLGSSLEELVRLSRLIDGLLFIARAEDPNHAVEHTRFPVRRELDAVCDFYEALAAERHIGVECEGDAWLNGDSVLFRQAVSNLLANALNYTLNEGRVTMTATQKVDGGVEVRVSDTGPGISTSHLPHVFERFYRVEEGQARVTGGAGLGLAIVQSIMQLHGGNARIESAVGHGTTVRLEFPAVVPTADAAAT